MIMRRLASGFLCCQLILVCLAGMPRPSVAQPTAQAAAGTPVAFDSVLTDQARILAGIMPLDTVRFARILHTKAWAQHYQVFTESWGKYRDREKVMEQWRDSNLAPVSTKGATLFYPFSGPDFLNADIFFPGCSSYVFLSLESVGSLPDTGIDDAHFSRLSQDIHQALYEIFKRNYFITDSMRQNLHTPVLKGNLPIFMVFLAQRDCRIVSITRVTLNAAGGLEPAGADSTSKKRLVGTQILFVKQGGAVQQLVYFPGDIQNSALTVKPSLLKYLQTLPNPIMMTKAASYLMHDKSFSMVRDICLACNAVFQDDSGIPFKFFKSDRWNMMLFGKYSKPIKAFNYGFQPDLDKAYKTGTVPALPFTFGYHVSDGFSNIQLAVKK